MINYQKKQYKLAKFIEDYDMYRSYNLGTDKVLFGNKNKKKCRFCGKEEGEVPFSMIAHSVPEFMGNKKLISFYECDECNKYFANTCEQNLGNYLTVYRSLLGSRGKKGIVKYKKHNKKIFTDKEEGARVIICKQGSENMDINEEKKEIYVSNESEPYIPSEVYKCFIKMFLSLIIEEDLVGLERYLLYISRLNDNNLILQSGAIICDAFVPVKLGNRIDIFKRRDKYDYRIPYLSEIPKYIMVCYFEYFIFQIPVFDIEKLKLYKRKINIDMFPIVTECDFYSEGEINWRILDWYSKEVTTCKQQLTFGFDKLDSSETIKTRAEEVLRNNKF